MFGRPFCCARDAYWRAGGLAPVVVIPVRLAEMPAGRLRGLMLGHYRLEPGGVMVIISTRASCHPVEMG